MLARRSLLIVLANVLGALGGLVVLFVVGRYMGPAPYGMVGFSLSIVSLAAILARFGFDAAHRKRVSEGQSLAACMGTYVPIKLALVAGYAVIIGAAATVWHRYAGFVDATTYPVLMLMLGYAVMLELRLVPAFTFDALLQTARTQTTMLVEQLVRVPLVVVAALAFGAATGQWVPAHPLAEAVGDLLGLSAGLTPADGALLLAAAFALGMVASTAAGWWMLRRTPRAPFDRRLARSYARFALPLALLTVTGTMLLEMDRFMIGYFWGATDVGYYFAAQRIVQLALLVPTAVATLFFPMLSELAAKRATDGVRELVTTTQRALSLIMVFLTLCIAVFALEGIRVLQSGRFDAAAPMLQVLSLYALTMGFFAVAQNIVFGYDRPKVAAYTGLAMLGVNLALNLALIPTSLLGVPLAGAKGLGAAWSTVASQAVGTAILMMTARRLTGHWTVGRSSLRHLAAGAITAGTLLWAKTWAFGGVDGFIEVAAMGVVALAVYVGILTAWRELTRKDWLFVQDLLHPRRMARAIREDFTEQRDR